VADKKYSIDFVGRDRTKSAATSVKQNLKSIEGGVASLRNVWVGASGVFAAVGVSKLFSEVARETVELEQTTLRLDAVYKATGGTVGLAVSELENFIETMNQESVFGQNQIRDAAAIMLTFKNVQEETFTEGIRLAADLSAVMNQDLKSSVVQIGKALEDPVKGMSALADVGVSFTPVQQEMIKNFQETNDLASAQAVILETLEGQFGGTAKNLKGGLHGSMLAVNEEWERLLRAAGNSDFAQGVVTGFFQSVESGLRNMREEIEKGNWVASYLKIIGESLPGPIGPTLQAGGEFLEDRDDRRRDSGTIRGPDGEQTAEEFYADHAKVLDDARKSREKKDADAAAAATKRREAWAKESARLTKEEISHWARLEAEKERFHEAEIGRAIRQMQVNQDWLDDTDEAIRDAIDVGQELKEAREQEHAARMQQLLSEGTALTQSIANERDVLNDWFRIKSELLDELEAEQFTIKGGWDNQRLLLTKEFQERETAIVNAEMRKRFGISNYYRKLDLDSAQFFLGQMSVLMTTNSRSMFEVGKAAAIGETIIQTYRAAQGAFASLASIPIVGPALGAAAAAAAVLGGMARVQAIRSQSFGAGSGVAPVAPASPITGLPSSSASNLPPTEFEQQAERQAPRVVNIQIESDSGFVSASWVRDKLLPTISEAAGDGVIVKGY